MLLLPTFHDVFCRCFFTNSNETRSKVVRVSPEKEMEKVPTYRRKGEGLPMIHDKTKHMQADKQLLSRKKKKIMVNGVIRSHYYKL